MSLSPFRLSPFFRTRIWGFQNLAPWFDYATDGEPIGEVWLTGDQCEAATGQLKGVPLSEIAAKHGEALLGSFYRGEGFPLLIKVLFPKEMLSVQVHPDDAMAQKYGEPRGKTECWYALDAKPDAKVALGLKAGATLSAVREGIEDSTLEELLDWLPVHAGDMIYVDAGTVHAIGPGAVLLETQQNSDLTYRMYDYGRGRELHVEQSLEATRLTTKAGLVEPKTEGSRTTLIDVPYFRVDRFALDGADAGAQLQADAPEMQILFLAKGKAVVRGEGFEPFALEKCQIAIVPAASGPWTLDAEEPVEALRITPQAGPK